MIFFLRGVGGWEGVGVGGEREGEPETTEFGFLMLAVLNVCIASAKQQIK